LTHRPLALPLLALSLPTLAAIGVAPAIAQTHPGDWAAAIAQLTCANTDPDLIDITVRMPKRSDDCLRLTGGFSGDAGSFVRATALASDVRHTGGTFSVSLEQSERLRALQAGFAKKSLFGMPIEGGVTIYGQRFKYNQGRDSSLFAFQPAIQEFQSFWPDDLVKYVEHSYGAMLFARYRLRESSSFGISYGFDVSDIRPLTAGTNDYFHSIGFMNSSGPVSLTGIRTSKVTPSFTYNTVDNAVRPAHGVAVLVSTALAGLGGNVRTVEPVVDAKFFSRGVLRKHVIGLHLRGSMIVGYGGREAPPFDRYYAGGENEIRGFDSWSISPVIALQSVAAINQLNPDGSQRFQNVLVNGVKITIPVLLSIPIYRVVSPGGDTKVVANVEYRIPLCGPFTLVLFNDAGLNRLTFVNQLRPVARIDDLSAMFPQAGFTDNVIAAGATEKIRMSTGVELQIFLKRVNAPLRFYWAYNPLIVQGYLEPPIGFDRSTFPNVPTFSEALGQYGTPREIQERRNMFRFSIGRTF
jgi:outer membrane protein insertion porin family